MSYAQKLILVEIFVWFVMKITNLNFVEAVNLAEQGFYISNLSGGVNAQNVFKPKYFTGCAYPLYKGSCLGDDHATLTTADYLSDNWAAYLKEEQK